MSLEQLESSIRSLTIDERRQFARWIDEHYGELFQDGEDEELTDEQRAEILRRREQALAHPDLVEPWDGTVERVRQRLHGFRRQKTSSC